MHFCRCGCCLRTQRTLRRRKGWQHSSALLVPWAAYSLRLLPAAKSSLSTSAQDHSFTLASWQPASLVSAGWSTLRMRMAVHCFGHWHCLAWQHCHSPAASCSTPTLELYFWRRTSTSRQLGNAYQLWHQSFAWLCVLSAASITFRVE